MGNKSTFTFSCFFPEVNKWLQFLKITEGAGHKPAAFILSCFLTLGLSPLAEAPCPPSWRSANRLHPQHGRDLHVQALHLHLPRTELFIFPSAVWWHWQPSTLLAVIKLLPLLSLKQIRFYHSCSITRCSAEQLNETYCDLYSLLLCYSMAYSHSQHCRSWLSAWTNGD